MSSADQDILSTLSNLSSDILNFSTAVAAQTESHIDSIANSIRSTLSSSTWLPSYARPPPPPPPPPATALTVLARSRTWISHHRALTAALVAFAGSGAAAYYLQVHRQHPPRAWGSPSKRRAARARNGARTEVVVIAGPIASAYTKSLALDLERRGFIVYVVVHSVEEEAAVHAERRADVRPLHLELEEPLGEGGSVQRFAGLLARERGLQFAGLLLVPDLGYPLGPVQGVDIGLWSDALNSKVVGAVAVAQAFLPTVIQHGTKVLMLTPTIASSTRPAFHAVESTTVGALEGFTASLRQEMATLGITVVHLKLGSFDCGRVGDRHQLASLGGGSPSSSLTQQWPGALRRLYGENYITASRRGARAGLFSETGSTAGGSSLRELHHAVFDVLTGRRTNGVIRVGRRSRGAELVGSLAPARFVSWMLGLRRVEHVGKDERAGEFGETSATWEKVEDDGLS